MLVQDTEILIAALHNPTSTLQNDNKNTSVTSKETETDNTLSDYRATCEQCFHPTAAKLKLIVWQ